VFLLRLNLFLVIILTLLLQTVENWMLLVIAIMREIFFRFVVVSCS